MKVIANIQSTLPCEPGTEPEPVDMTWYTGDNLAKAMAAMTGAMAIYDDDPGYTRVLSVRVVF